MTFMAMTFGVVYDHLVIHLSGRSATEAINVIRYIDNVLTIWLTVSRPNIIKVFLGDYSKTCVS